MLSERQIVEKEKPCVRYIVNNDDIISSQVFYAISIHNNDITTRKVLKIARKNKSNGQNEYEHIERSNETIKRYF